MMTSQSATPNDTDAEQSTTVIPSIQLDTLSQQQLLLPSNFITHQPNAGLNPLVDATAYLFSIMGKLKQLNHYQSLNKLHQELLQEINIFQDAAKAQGYTSEYIIVSRYAICATLDEIIANSAWGSQGQWNNYNLIATLNQETLQQDRFFIILDRISKEPALYIDVMELMYLCLSFGYKGNYRTTEFCHHQLEQITNALYKRIRAHRGDFSKTLSPFSIRTTPHRTAAKKPSIWLAAFITLSIILGIFTGLGCLLDTLSNQAYQELMHIGKTLLYETHNT